MAYVLAVASAFANALTSILQRMGVEDAPADSSMRLSLLAHAIRRGVWLAGFVLLTGSFVLQAVALHLGQMTSVQPILTTELLFLVAILVVWFGFKVAVRDWIAAVAAAAGLAGFLYFAQPGQGFTTPSTLDWIEVGGTCAFVVLVAIALARTGPRWWRAAMFGTAAAIGYAFTASLTKVVTGFVAHDWLSMFVHWQTYVLACTGLLSVFLAQNAFHAGPIAASQSTLVLVDPLASILIGIFLFNNDLRTSEPWGALEAASLLVLFAGVATLCQSPLVSGVKGEDAEYHEMLSSRGRSRWRAEHQDGAAMTTRQPGEHQPGGLDQPRERMPGFRHPATGMEHPPSGMEHPHAR